MAEIDLGKVVGPQGEPGAKGDTGKEGPQGPPGPEGVVDGNSTITFVTPEAYQEPQSGDSIANLFGRFKRWILNLQDNLGPLSSLKTPDKSSTVAAVNANYDSIAQLEEDVGNPTDLTTDAKEVVGAVNELNSALNNIVTSPVIGEVTNYTTSEKEYINIAWSSYHLLLITWGSYGNVYQTILIPSTYIDSTNSGKRIIVGNDELQIYKKSENSLSARATTASQINRAIIYGIMPK